MSNEQWGKQPYPGPLTPGQQDVPQQGWASHPQGSAFCAQPPQQAGAWGGQGAQGEAFGVQPSQGGAFGAPPQQAGAWGGQGAQGEAFGAQPSPGGAFGVPQQGGAFGAQPPQQAGAWGGQGGQGGAFGAQSSSGGAFGVPQQGGAFGAQPQQGGVFGAPPQQAGPWGGQGGQGGAFGGQPPQGGVFVSPQQGGAWGAQPSQGAFGTPGQGGAFVPPQGGAFPKPGGVGGAFVAAAGQVGTKALGRLVPRLIGGGCVTLIALAFAGYGWWHSNELADPTSETTLEHVRDHITSTFRRRMVEIPRASQLCGYLVRSASNVRVSDIVTQGSAFAGSGTAVVTLDAVPEPGVTPPTSGPCTASFRFDYRITTRHEGRRRIENTTLNEVQQFRPIAVGATVTGTLQAGDARFDDGAGTFDDWGIQLTANQPVTIVVRGGPETTNPGNNLDVMVGILDVRGTILAQDDDSAGNWNARIVFTPPSDGLYFIRVTHALSGTHFGAYTLVTAAGANPNAT